MMQQRRVHKSVTILSLMLGVMLLSGCGNLPLTSLPEKERYQRINDVLDTLDYETAGTIVANDKDNGDGVFTPSIIRVEYDDANSFDTLSERIPNLSNLSCSSNLEVQIWCKSGQVDVSITRPTVNDPTVILQVTDRYNGREAK